MDGRTNTHDNYVYIYTHIDWPLRACLLPYGVVHSLRRIPLTQIGHENRAGDTITRFNIGRDGGEGRSVAGDQHEEGCDLPPGQFNGNRAADALGCTGNDGAAVCSSTTTAAAPTLLMGHEFIVQGLSTDVEAFAVTIGASPLPLLEPIIVVVVVVAVCCRIFFLRRRHIIIVFFFFFITTTVPVLAPPWW